MYAHLPSVEFAVDRKGFVLVDGKRVLTQPDQHLLYQSCTLLTCQHCGRRAIAHSLRVVCEPDERMPDGKRYFHAPSLERSSDLCIDCHERNQL